jgi:hypothetical protein
MRERILASAFCLVLFVTAIPQPALLTGDGNDGIPGWLCLIFGFFFLAGFANPALLISHIAMWSRKDRWALRWSLVALALSLITFFIKEYPTDTHPDKIVGYGQGFYLWMGSIVVTVVYQAALYWRGYKTTAPPPLPKMG